MGQRGCALTKPLPSGLPKKYNTKGRECQSFFHEKNGNYAAEKVDKPRKTDVQYHVGF
jgi:hypothetical protein